MSETGIETLRYTSEPAVEHIAWEDTADGIVLTILPVPMTGTSLAMQIASGVGAIVFIVWLDRNWVHWLPFLVAFVYFGVNSVMRFWRSRAPIHIHVERGRLKVTGPRLAKTHDWPLDQIRDVRAPILSVAGSGAVMSAIEIVPAKDSAVSIGAGRRLEEMQWAAKKLLNAMTATGWVRRKSTARRLGERVGRIWRRRHADA